MLTLVEELMGPPARYVRGLAPELPGFWKDQG